MRTADLLVSEGYAAAGYEYLIIDDCWMEKERNEITNELMPDRERFPSGLSHLSAYVSQLLITILFSVLVSACQIHNKSLKFGLYHDIGARTCMHLGPGAKGFHAIDAKTFAKWNVDYVKLDGCYVQGIDLNKAYPAFGQALNKTGRPMVYSCSWPYYQNHVSSLQIFPKHFLLEKVHF